jgi:hypothetical protein
MVFILQNDVKNASFFITSVQNSGESRAGRARFEKNKANFRKAQMNLKSIIIRNYEEKWRF